MWLSSIRYKKGAVGIFFAKPGISIVLSLFFIFISLEVSALEQKFKFGGDNVYVDIDTQFSLGTMWRVQSPDKNNITPGLTEHPVGSADYIIEQSYIALMANGNDGNRNFDTGTVSNRLGMLVDVAMEWRNVGAFLRGNYFYDTVYQDGGPESYSTDSGSVEYPNDFGGDTVGEFDQQTEDELGSGFQWLDAYVYAYLDIFDHDLNLRIGKQVVSWGESLVFQNGISSAQNPVDQFAGLRAGVELKEIFLPTGAVYGQVDITDQLSFEAYSQYEFKPIQMAPAGSYWADTDFLGNGAGKVFYIPIVGGATRVRGERDTSDSGQWGIAMRYLSDAGDELAFYHLVYHDKAISYDQYVCGFPNNPSPCDFGYSVNPVNGSYYRTQYQENIRLYGLSVSTVIGSTSVAGELSYRPNYTVQLDGLPFESNDGSIFPFNTGEQGHIPGGVGRKEYWQGQLSWIHIFSPSRLYDSVTFSGEVVGWAYGGVEDKDLHATNQSSGVAVQLINQVSYKNVFMGVDVTIPMTWSYGIDGNHFKVNARHHASVASIGVSALYLDRLNFSLIYTQYDGPGSSKPSPTFYHLRDRDNIAFAIKYAF